jgi:hypothetical protein
MNEREKEILELLLELVAGIDPSDIQMSQGRKYWQCRYCRQSRLSVVTEENHAPYCLWLRAQELARRDDE